MSRAIAVYVFIFSCMSLSRGVDYVTGNSVDRGRLLDDALSMPMVWGTACLVGGALGIISLYVKSGVFAVNTAIVNFAVSVMLGVQVFHADMLPTPWPPEDVRIATDHFGQAAAWAATAFTLWWREGVRKRTSGVVEEVGNGF